MNSREKILADVKKNQPALLPLPELEEIGAIKFDHAADKFKQVLESIGGSLVFADNLQQVAAYVQKNFVDGNRYVTTLRQLDGIAQLDPAADPHDYADVEVAIIKGEFGVAENSAIWVCGDAVQIRVLPFICQHLVIVLHWTSLVHNMHEAYARIGTVQYDYGVFIAGPSKTADIEQSLVLGAHGAKSLTVFLLGSSPE